MTKGRSQQKGKPKTKNFSSFSLDQAFEEVQVEKLLPWKIEQKAIAPSDFL
jgi:hypothetical protein